MRLSSAALLTLAIQWLLGAMLIGAVACLQARRKGRRRPLVAWAGAARASRRALPYAALLALAGAGLALMSPGGLLGALSAIWVHPVGFILLGATPAAACHVMVHAGRLEARGRFRVARYRARLAGELVFVGAQTQLLLVWTGLLLRAPLRRTLVLEVPAAGLLLLLASAAVLIAAFLAVAGALARKPRPTSYVACALYVLGIVGIVAAYQSTL